MALAWDRADIAQKDVLVSGQHWQVRLSESLLKAVVVLYYCNQGIFYIVKIFIVAGLKVLSTGIE